MKSIKTFNVFILVTFSFLSMLSPIAIDMYLPAMPEIVSYLHTSTMSLQFSLQAFLAGLAFGRLVYGPVSDALGRYPVLLVSLIFYMAISIGIAVCDNMLTFNILRLLQGLAASGISVIVIAMIHDRFTGDSFSKCISLVSMVMTAAPLFSPTIGAYLSVYLGWEAIFWLFAICALLGIIISLRNLNESLDSSVRHRLSLVVICRNYLEIIKHCPSYLYILSGALSFSGVFCFLTTGSFIYQHIYHVDVVSVGYLLGLNIIVLLIFTTLNSLFVKRVGSLNLLLLFAGVQLFASL
jgi:DHA1 family bicyclomycin/chloramphenicol resistance-like MFS transporter